MSSRSVSAVGKSTRCLCLTVNSFSGVKKRAGGMIPDDSVISSFLSGSNLLYMYVNRSLSELFHTTKRSFPMSRVKWKKPQSSRRRSHTFSGRTCELAVSLGKKVPLGRLSMWDWVTYVVMLATLRTDVRSSEVILVRSTQRTSPVTYVRTITTDGNLLIFRSNVKSSNSMRSLEISELVSVVTLSRLMKIAADKGNTTAMNKYGLILKNGSGVSADKKLACHYLKMAADNGQTGAMFTYASILKKRTRSRSKQ